MKNACLIVFVLFFNACSTHNRARLVAPTNIAKPQSGKFTETTEHGLLEIKKNIKSAEQRADKIKELLEEYSP